jgi:hypothetical protein
MFKILAALISMMVLGFLLIRVRLKVRMIEKKCDKIRENKPYANDFALKCSRLIIESNLDVNKVFEKLKPLIYQINLHEHTIYLCHQVNKNTFLIVTIFGDSNLIPLNYKLELDFYGNKIKVLGEKKDTSHTGLQLQFVQLLNKYCLS